MITHLLILLRGNSQFEDFLVKFIATAVTIGGAAGLAWLFKRLTRSRPKKGQYVIRALGNKVVASREPLDWILFHDTHWMNDQEHAIESQFEGSQALETKDGKGLALSQLMVVRPSKNLKDLEEGFKKWKKHFGSTKWMTEFAQPLLVEASKAYYKSLSFDEITKSDMSEVKKGLRQHMEPTLSKLRLSGVDLKLKILEPQPVPLPQNA